MDERVKIALVDDHEMFRAGLKFIIDEKPEWEVVIEAVNGQNFLDQAELLTPEIVLLDISMPVLNGFDTAKLALEKFPGIKIIVLSMHSDQEYYQKMIEFGVMGFIPKDSGVDELIRAIEEVSKGNNYFSQDLLKKIILTINTNTVDKQLSLNEKEKKILTLICNGNTNQEIADLLFLSIKTIEKYRHGLIKKTNTRNTAQLVMYTIKNKLVNI